MTGLEREVRRIECVTAAIRYSFGVGLVRELAGWADDADLAERAYIRRSLDGDIPEMERRRGAFAAAFLRWAVAPID